MADASELYQKLEDIRAAIKNHTSPDGTCQFNINEVIVTLNLALRCITEPQE